MSDEDNQKRDWIDIGLKAATPLLVGVVVAWVGLFGDETLTRISNQQQSLQLLAQLQIERDKADSDLRKDTIAKVLKTFFQNGIPNQELHPPTMLELSDRLVLLELLVLNYGDSINLVPLFSKMRSDLRNMRPINDAEKRNINFKLGQAILLRRLDLMAQRIAGQQLSSLKKHGVSKSIWIPLSDEYALRDSATSRGVGSCVGIEGFSWPRDHLLSQYGLLDNDWPANVLEIDDTLEGSDYQEDYNYLATIQFQGIERTLDIHVSYVDYCEKSVQTQVIIKRKGTNEPEINQEFQLDYFNFTKVNNTSLSVNHQFAIVVEKFHLDVEGYPRLEMTAVIFPSEHAGALDRASRMEGVRKILGISLDDEYLR